MSKPPIIYAGTPELAAVPVGGTERWKVEFDMRGQSSAA